MSKNTENADVYVRFKNVTKKFGNITAVSNVNLDIHKGEIVGFAKGLRCQSGNVLSGSEEEIAAVEALGKQRGMFIRQGGPADIMVFPESIEELRGVLRVVAANDLPLFALGGGSDLIVRDGGFRGVCVKLGRNFCGSRQIDTERIAVASTCMR